MHLEYNFSWKVIWPQTHISVNFDATKDVPQVVIFCQNEQIFDQIQILSYYLCVYTPTFSFFLVTSLTKILPNVQRLIR
uniref:Uncharacterized protein n=1 Tax=Meloidogyne enterolobii TaxID=390850 RepID=A0A6V7W1Y7_MELEN|nr:unnamed protein product [Meloidogyne enterolobii]